LIKTCAKSRSIGAAFVVFDDGRITKKQLAIDKLRFSIK